MKKSDFYYDLPQERIAQTPLEPRDSARMMLIDRQTGAISHKIFRDIAALLRPEDCLILNDTRVLPARLYGRRADSGTTDTSSPVEFLLLRDRGGDCWEVLCGPGKKAVPGRRFTFAEGLLEAEILEVLPEGNRLARFFYDGNFFAILDRVGEMPLPHYITETLTDAERYQTVYARERGSAAAPTAGLHFTPELLEQIRQRGVSIGFVTLHVGLGTFRPVKAEAIEEHHMHAEYYTLPEETAALINRTKQQGGRVVAVGTTCCRTLETAARVGLPLRAGSGWTDIFIYPGFRFQCIDALITNFHLPESTLIMLVSAFMGQENTRRAYQIAVAEGYRFYSFGDAMFIL